MDPKDQAPCVTLGLEPSFGFGDRIGLATPGHARAMQRSGTGILPIFPQQSIREMNRTLRSATQVMEDALRGAKQGGWHGPIGADADHLKTFADVDLTAAAGFTFFTIDPSAAVDQRADDYTEGEVREKFATLVDCAPWYTSYLGQRIELPSGQTVVLDEEAVMRGVVKYGRAIADSLAMSQYIAQVHQPLGRPYEIELSVDETEQPTTLAEHYMIADQCLLGGMKLVSLAPRFIGELEKGVDYKGDVQQLESSLADHAAIARMLGPYKLSLHSGSDKLSMYALLARATEGRFHVKTAGTSYLEALRVVARHDTGLFRALIRFARSRYESDRATYHVSATLEGVPDEAVLSTPELEQVYLQRWSDIPPGEGRGFTAPGRQILHCTFGSTLTDPQLGPAIHSLIAAHGETYAEVLEDHFCRHLEALRAGM